MKLRHEGGFAHPTQGMVEVFNNSVTDLADPRVIGDSVDAVLGGKKLMESLEEESWLITVESFSSWKLPNKRPVKIWILQFNPDRKKFLSGANILSIHQNSVFQQHPIPLLCGHDWDI